MNWVNVLRLSMLVGAAMILVGIINGGFSSSATDLPRALCFAGTVVSCGAAVVMGVLTSRKSGT